MLQDSWGGGIGFLEVGESIWATLVGACIEEMGHGVTQKKEGRELGWDLVYSITTRTILQNVPVKLALQHSTSFCHLLKNSRHKVTWSLECRNYYCTSTELLLKIVT